MENESGMGSAEYLELARQLVTQLEAGDEEAANATVDDLTRMRESEMFQQIGRLTRDLHDSLNSFQLDTRISTLAEEEIPDARDRLRYVVSMTDQAATRTLNAVEESIPLCDELQSNVSEIDREWQRFLRRELSADEFRALSRAIRSHLSNSGDELVKLKSNLNDILMAQDFQDLTGQIIHRVIGLVEEVEGNLVELIRISGSSRPAGEAQQGGAANQEERRPDIDPQGPQVPGVDADEAVNGQDEVDELLSSLGF
ncbi:MAG: protein phosphatase CheZ [Pseudomonadota bacterium]